VCAGLRPRWVRNSGRISAASVSGFAVPPPASLLGRANHVVRPREMLASLPNVAEIREGR
jgi:hypothetical protein